MNECKQLPLKKHHAMTSLAYRCWQRTSTNLLFAFIVLTLSACQKSTESQNASSQTQQSNEQATASMQPAKLQAAIRVENKRRLTDFALIDDQGNPFGREQLLGQWSLVFFGFTRCPDICPPTLSQLSAIHNWLAQRTDATTTSYPVRTVFISVDPEHDTPELMQQYLQGFKPQSDASTASASMVGLTGDKRQVRALATQLGVAFETQHAHHQHGAQGSTQASPAQADPEQEEPGRTDPAGQVADSSVIHSGSVLVLDPEAYLHAIFAPPLPAPGAMRDDIAQIIQEPIGL